MFLGLIVLNPTPLFHGKPAEWGCFYGFGYRSYNFSLGLGFSGRSGSGSSLLLMQPVSAGRQQISKSNCIILFFILLIYRSLKFQH